MLILLTRPFTEDEARAVAGWSYPAPFDMYDVGPDNWRLFLQRTPDGEGYYPALDRRGSLVAFCQLETGNQQKAAIAFYRRHGFAEVPRFGPYVDSETSVCMQRTQPRPA